MYTKPVGAPVSAKLLPKELEALVHPPRVMGEYSVAHGLSKLQRKILAVQPTQTASERIFSRLRLVTAGRDSLTNDNIELFTLSSANVRALTDLHASFRPPPVSEEDDPIEERGAEEDDTDVEDDFSFASPAAPAAGGAGAASVAVAAASRKRRRHEKPSEELAEGADFAEFSDSA